MSKETKGPRKPNVIDVQVGTRIRLRRKVIGMSQEMLGEALGVTFQQVQKYEQGKNRVGASRLWNLAQALGVAVPYFFQDIGEENEASSDADKSVVDFIQSPDGVSFALALDKLKPAIRRSILEHVRVLGSA